MGPAYPTTEGHRARGVRNDPERAEMPATVIAAGLGTFGVSENRFDLDARGTARGVPRGRSRECRRQCASRGEDRGNAVQSLHETRSPIPGDVRGLRRPEPSERGLAAGRCQRPELTARSSP
jgi:hypothetical protein